MTKRIIGVVLFDQFEMLDVFGPLEMFGVLLDAFEIRMLAEQSGSVASTPSPRPWTSYVSRGLRALKSEPHPRERASKPL
jgi:hypothetical protein